MLTPKTKKQYGMVIHYGAYAAAGFDDVVSAKRRKTQNGSEWYYGRLIDNNTFRPISGSTATKEYHRATYGDMDYFDMINEITTDENKVKDWVTIAKTKNASYIILTSKHHDGVCLFNTETTPHKSELDICKVFSDECKRQDILFGFYYSWFEFGIPFTKKYFSEYCLPQLNELMRYAPNYMWFDGDWVITQKTIQADIKRIIQSMKSDNILVNDRIGKNNYDEASYRVFSDRYIPKEPLLDIKWQHINTIGYSWGFNKMQTSRDYKTKEQIMSLYEQIHDLGGMFLINVGPNKDAVIVKEELDALPG